MANSEFWTLNVQCWTLTHIETEFFPNSFLNPPTRHIDFSLSHRGSLIEQARTELRRQSTSYPWHAITWRVREHGMWGIELNQMAASTPEAMTDKVSPELSTAILCLPITSIFFFIRPSRCPSSLRQSNQFEDVRKNSHSVDRKHLT